MRNQISIAVLALTASALSACSHTTRVASGGNVYDDVIPASARVLPAGSVFDVRLDRDISASRNRVGDGFTARVPDAVTAQNGSVVIPAGAVVEGVITGIEPPRDPSRSGLIRLDFRSLNVDGRSYPFDATVERTSASARDNDMIRKAEAGAVVGGILGAVIGRDVKDALIGGAIGAAAGSLISLGTDNANATLPEGTRLTIRNDRRLVFRY